MVSSAFNDTLNNMKIFPENLEFFLYSGEEL